MSPYRGPASLPPAFRFPSIKRLDSSDLWLRPFLLSLALTVAFVVLVVIPAVVPGVDVFADPMRLK